MSCVVPILSNLSVTGDCSNTNSGAFSFDVAGSAPPFVLTWITPSGGTSVSINTPPYNYSLNGLSGGSYQFQIVDSCVPPSPAQIFSINISTGTCVSIDTIENTLCGLDNGSLTASTSYNYGQTNFYLYDTTNGYITSGFTLGSPEYVFTSLSASTYYVIADDGGGCTGSSESCIIKSSTTLTFDFYIVNDANCSGSGSGAVYVTNLNGTGPYTYLWNDGETTSYITGKTAGSYTVQITDSSGCVQSGNAIIAQVPPLGLGTTISTQPSCFSSDGTLTVTITGGTPPYYFSGSNGDSLVTLGQTYTFTNLPAGAFNFKVTDLGFCYITGTDYLLPTEGFSVVDINIINSNCGDGQGIIEVQLAGGIGNYVYILKDSTSTVIEVITTTNSTQLFTNLYSDTYEIIISGGSCVYSTFVTVTNNPLLSIGSSFTGSTCDQCNGAIELTVSGGLGSFIYKLTGPSYSITTPALSVSAQTFTNLCPGSYVGSIRDAVGNRCVVTTNILIPVPPNVNFSLFPINPSPYSNDGSITALITDGTPPFTWTWSSNVNGQTGLTVNNLSAGTYTLQVIDDEGCTLTKTATTIGYTPVTSYQIFNICNDDFTNTGLLLTKGPKQMLNEGFYDLTSGDTNCILNAAYFTAIVTVGDNTKTETFYTGYTLNDYPSDLLWTETIETILLTYDGITGVTTNIEDNTIKITTPCYTLDGSQVKIDMLINYDISCESIEPPAPCYCFALIDVGALPQDITFTNCYTSVEETIRPGEVIGSPGKFPYICSQTQPIRQDGLPFFISANTCDSCCRCYIMSGNSSGIDATGTTYQYLDCNGAPQTVVLGPDEEQSVCASVIPWLLSTDNDGNIYSNSGSSGANYFPLCTGSPPTCPT